MIAKNLKTLNQRLHLRNEEYKILNELCFYSKNLYNVTLYETKQHFKNTNQFLSYERAYKIVKENENYSKLYSWVSQQTMKVVERSFRSFFALLHKKQTGQYRNDVNIPKYIKKDGKFALIYPFNKSMYKNNELIIPLGNHAKNNTELKTLKFLLHMI